MFTNIWNMKQYRTKLPLSMFFVELKPAPNKYSSAKYNFNCPNTKRVLLNVQTVKNMGTPKIIAISNRDVSNAQVNT
jgi:hypothetical protein